MATSKRGAWGHIQRVDGFRSRFEADVAEYLTSLGLSFDYEGLKVPYFDDGRLRNYSPDFPITGTNIVIECKGRFTSQDRTKHLLIREQYPELDLRFVFQRSANKINPDSKTTYASWCAKAGFLYADKFPPKEWFA